MGIPMSNYRRITLFGLVLLAVSILLNCTKEVGEDELVQRNGLIYERNSDEPFSGNVVKYKSGQKIEEFPVEDGIQEGIKRLWYDDGQIKGKFKFTAGEVNGTFEMWHENGKKSVEQEYSHGVEDGTFESWHENGKKDVELEFEDGLIDGTYESWYENGQKKFKIDLKSGTFDGDFESWHENGKKCIIIDDIKSTEVLESPYLVYLSALGIESIAKLQYSRSYILDGTYRDWYENGQKKTKAEFDDGELDGPIKRWDEDGKRMN